MSKATEIERLLFAGTSRKQIEEQLETSASYVRAVISRARDRGDMPPRGTHRLYACRGLNNSGHCSPVVPASGLKAVMLKRAGFSDWEIQQAMPSRGF